MKFLKRKKKVPKDKNAKEEPEGTKELPPRPKGATIGVNDDNGVVSGNKSTVDNEVLAVEKENSNSAEVTGAQPTVAVESKMSESSDKKSASTSKSRLFGLSKKKSAKSMSSISQSDEEQPSISRASSEPSAPSRGLIMRRGSRKSSKRQIMDPVTETETVPVEPEPEPEPAPEIPPPDSNIDATEYFSLDKESNILKCEVGASLFELSELLIRNKRFLPFSVSADCSFRIYPEEYGQMSRSFGVLNDYVIGYEITIKKKDGSEDHASVWKPGLGHDSRSTLSAKESRSYFVDINSDSYDQTTIIITHIYMSPLKDEDFPDSRGMKLVTAYSSAKLVKCLQVMAEMSDNHEFSRNLDYRVTVLTHSADFWYKKSLGEEFEDDGPIVDGHWKDDEEGGTEINTFPVIVVYMQWANVEGNKEKFGRFETGWFRAARKALGNDFIDASLHPKANFSFINYNVKCLLEENSDQSGCLSFLQPTPMSELTRYWVYDEIRPYVMAHENHVSATDSITLSADGWSTWLSERVDKVVSGHVSNVKAVIQVQPFGGQYSMWSADKNQTTIVQRFDIFSEGEDGGKATAWKVGNERGGVSFKFRPLLTTPESNVYFPSLPTSLKEIKRALIYAKNEDFGVLAQMGDYDYNVMTSKSGGKSVLLDVTKLSQFFYDKDINLAKVGMGNSIVDLNMKLHTKGLFLPQGQSAHSLFAAHSRKKDFGQIGRSHGIFSDYIEGFEYVTTDDGYFKTKIVWKPGSKHNDDSVDDDENDVEMYNALVRGETDVLENVGVLSAVYVTPLCDSDYPNSRAMKAITPYTVEKLLACLQLMAEMSDDGVSRDFDYRITVVTDARNFWFKESAGDLYDNDDPMVLSNDPDGEKIPIISVYLQWANTGGDGQKFGKAETAWFRSVRKAMGPGTMDCTLDDSIYSHLVYDVKRLRDKKKSSLPPLEYSDETAMSELTRYWLYDEARPYVLPHDEIVFTTDSASLSTEGWSDWLTKKIDSISDGRAVVQIQIFGGDESMYVKGAEEEGIQSLKIVHKFDCFQSEKKRKVSTKKWAEKFKKEGDKFGIVRMKD